MQPDLQNFCHNKELVDCVGKAPAVWLPWQKESVQRVILACWTLDRKPSMTLKLYQLRSGEATQPFLTW